MKIAHQVATPSNFLGYVAHSDPGGRLPVWITNKLSTVLAPKVIQLKKKMVVQFSSAYEFQSKKNSNIIIKKNCNPKLNSWPYKKMV